jgi:hypothetical protein
MYRITGFLPLVPLPADSIKPAGFPMVVVLNVMVVLNVIVVLLIKSWIAVGWVQRSGTQH